MGDRRVFCVVACVSECAGAKMKVITFFFARYVLIIGSLKSKKHIQKTGAGDFIHTLPDLGWPRDHRA